MTLNFFSISARKSSIASESCVAAFVLFPLAVEAVAVPTGDARSADGTAWKNVPIGIRTMFYRDERL